MTIADISIFLFGAISTLIPLVIWYLHMIGRKYIAECSLIKTSLDQTLTELNQLHNTAVSKYSAVDLRISKLETENAARNYGKVSGR